VKHMPEIDVNKFKKALNGKKVPLLVLDHKWHHLFQGEEKPEEMAEYEKLVNEYLQQQGSATQQLKELKKLKNTLMQNIVDNMDGADARKEDSIQSKKLTETKRLIEEANEKMEELEDSLIELPRLLKEANTQLMVSGMAYIYEKLHTNSTESAVIAEWIEKVRIELKKKIIRKQYCDMKNKEMFQYMNAILGAEVLDVFDIQYDENFELKKPEDTGLSGEENKDNN
jgi:hypothetical protein